MSANDSEQAPSHAATGDQTYQSGGITAPSTLACERYCLAWASLAASGPIESSRRGPGRTRLYHPRVHAGRRTDRVLDGQTPDLAIAGCFPTPLFLHYLSSK